MVSYALFLSLSLYQIQSLGYLKKKKEKITNLLNISKKPPETTFSLQIICSCFLFLDSQIEKLLNYDFFEEGGGIVQVDSIFSSSLLHLKISTCQFCYYINKRRFIGVLFCSSIQQLRHFNVKILITLKKSNLPVNFQSQSQK